MGANRDYNDELAFGNSDLLSLPYCIRF